MWPFKRQRNPAFETWPIVRTKPLGKTYGRSIELFVNNWQCHLATVDVYADGAIDCWGFVDRALLAGKVNTSWVVTSPKPDQTISVYNFGCTGVKDGVWTKTPRCVLEEVESIIRKLNPSMTGLVDMDGSDVEVRGRIRVAKLGRSDKKPYRRVAPSSDDVLGDSVPVLRVIGDAFELVHLFIFTDGQCQLGSDEILVPIEHVQTMFDSGKICNTAPVGAKVILPGLGRFRTTTEFGNVAIQSRMSEIRDKHDVLNGRPSVIVTCAKLFETYQTNPSPVAREALRNAYEAVPEHLRCYCGDMDTRDTAIRAVLYGQLPKT
jgi:hypothetical protein